MIDKMLLIDSVDFRRAAYLALLKDWSAGRAIDVSAAASLDEVAETSNQDRLVIVVGGAVPLTLQPDLTHDAGANIVAGNRVVYLADEVTPTCTDVALEIGLAGFLTSSEKPDILFASLDFIIAGGRFIPHHYDGSRTRTSVTPVSQMGTGVASRPVKSLGGDQLASSFEITERQAEVMKILANGESNKAIANRLGLSEATVKSHIRQLMLKLDVQNRTQAALVAHNILQP